MIHIHSFADSQGDRAVVMCAARDPFACMAERRSECPGSELIGWVQQGRKMASVENGRDVLWTQWQFVPAALGPAGEVRRSYIRAREDARVYAQLLAGAR